jgi:predicted ATP-dependent Lon-type protease
VIESLDLIILVLNGHRPAGIAPQITRCQSGEEDHFRFGQTDLPNGHLSKEDVAGLVELSLEGRRRVKEQLKKMVSFEFHQISFSLIDSETRTERFVGVPEHGGRNMISLDPLEPGSVYTSSVDDHAKVGLYRLEVGCSPVLVSSRSPVGSKG